MYIFENQICMFPDIILSLVSSQKLDWNRTFDTYTVYIPWSEFSGSIYGYICVYVYLRNIKHFPC